MLRLIQYAIWGFFRAVLFLRYRIRVSEKDKIKNLPGPILILPNHPAYIDPAIVIISLWPRLKPRPVVYETNFNNPVLWPIMKSLQALKVPDLEQASTSAREQAEQVVDKIIEGLKRGENYVLWPAGQLQHEGIERLGGARATSEILKAVDNLTIVQVRTQGVWGSMFSWAQTGASPSLVKRGLASIGYILANLIFFMPRRRVTLDLRVMKRDDIPDLERNSLNRWLEDWYNVDGKPEKPTWVRYHFLFGQRKFEFPELQTGPELDLSNVKPKTREVVAEILSDRLGRELTEEENRETTGMDELGLDSIDRMDVTLEIERRFAVSGGQSPSNVGQLWALAEGLADSGPIRPAPEIWKRPPSGSEPGQVLGDTIAQAFVERALSHPQDVAVADDLAGALTYERLLVGALLMAKHFRKLEEKYVGLLLPASVGGDLALLGLFLADKIPVIMNWTTGPGNLAHAAEAMKLKNVITSKAFIDRAGIEVKGTEYIYLEDVKAKIGTLGKLFTLLKVRWRKGAVRASLPTPSQDDHAVILFTSGSERAPKAVPLSHRNLLTDIRVGIPVLELTREDIILGFLPSFHSFGLTVTGLVPILGGLKVVHHPDPTDTKALIRKIEAYRPTLFAGTPTFVSHILNRCDPGQLNSLKIIVVGAEKCPDRVFERCRDVAPQAKIIEGYGITECSPVISANPPHAPRQGSVGRPLPGVDVQVVDLETHEPLEPMEQGMIQVSGPTVFQGYLFYDGPSPFVEREGKRWYVTGDLGELDSEGYLWFRGRLKRFIKAGGEMISLPALEEPFAQKFPPDEDGPRVAVEGVETDGGRHIVLFTKEEITLKEANSLLSEHGFRGVMRLDEVQQVESIPTLGTGKSDYKVLRGRIQEQLQNEEEPASMSGG